jgi:hypothetical protein
MEDTTSLTDELTVSMQAVAGIVDTGHARGIINVDCWDRNGNLLWHETIENLVPTLGKNWILNSAYTGSAYTAAEYMGLISSVSFSALAVGDTAAQINGSNGWKEVLNTGTNTPPYGTVRPTLAYSAAASGAIATSAAASFVFTNSGTVQGAFIVGGSGASATVGNTSGTLTNEGTFTTPQPVVSTNTITCTHTLTLT